MKKLKSVIPGALIVVFGNSFCFLDALFETIPEPPVVTVPAGPPASEPLTFYNYCPKGCPLTEADEAGVNYATNTFDSLGNLLSSTDSMGFTTYYSYDTSRNMTSDGITTYTYDPVTGKLASSTSVWGDSIYTWNVNGQLAGWSTTSLTMGNAASTMIYDAQNRLTSIDDGDATTTDFSFTYDSYGRISTFVMGGSGDFTIDYNSAGRINALNVSVDTGTGIATAMYSAGYDANGNMTTLTSSSTYSSTTTSYTNYYTYSPGVTEGRPGHMYLFQLLHILRYYGHINIGLI